MMTALVVSLVLGGTDSLDTAKLNGLVFKAPVEWKKTTEEGSLTWNAPDDGASLAVSVFDVDPQRPAKTCLDQLIPAVWPEVDGGASGPDRVMISASPAAKKVTTDFVGEGPDAKKDENKVTTTTIVGCNGKTKWVLTWTAKTKQASRFGPIFKRIYDSIAYGK
jgi:hypothetical protein